MLFTICMQYFWCSGLRSTDALSVCKVSQYLTESILILFDRNSFASSQTWVWSTLKNLFWISKRLAIDGEYRFLTDVLHQLRNVFQTFISLFLYHHHHLGMLTARIPLIFLPSFLDSPLDGIQCLHRDDKSFYCSSNTGMSMCRNPQKNVSYEFVLTSSAVPSVSSLSYLDGLWVGRLVAVQLKSYWVQLPGFVQSSPQFFFQRVLSDADIH